MKYIFYCSVPFQIHLELKLCSKSQIFAKIFAPLDNKSKLIWLLSNENIIIINIVIKLLMSLTETRTKLLSEVCPPGSLPSSHCIITSNIYYAYTYKYLPIKLYA